MSSNGIRRATLCVGSWVALTACAAGQLVATAPGAVHSASLLTAAPLKWKSSGILLEPVFDGEHQIVSVKAPSVVYLKDMWHIDATTANTRGHWRIVYLTFKDWSGAAQALKEHDVPHIRHVDSHGHDGTEWSKELYLFAQRILK
jgi:hypothetical protein